MCNVNRIDDSGSTELQKMTCGDVFRKQRICFQYDFIVKARVCHCSCFPAGSFQNKNKKNLNIQKLHIGKKNPNRGIFHVHIILN